MRMKNNLDNMDFKICTIIMTVSSVIILSMAVFSGKLLFMALILIAVFSSGPLAILYRDIIYSPKEVEIIEGGFMSYFRHGLQQFVSWNDITSLFYEKGDPTKYGPSRVGGACYSINGKIPKSLSLDVAFQIREAYARDIGRYPHLNEQRGKRK